jgi:hypothetical protein
MAAAYGWHPEKLLKIINPMLEGGSSCGWITSQFAALSSNVTRKLEIEDMLKRKCLI